MDTKKVKALKKKHVYETGQTIIKSTGFTTHVQVSNYSQYFVVEIVIGLYNNRLNGNHDTSMLRKYIYLSHRFVCIEYIEVNTL